MVLSHPSPAVQWEHKSCPKWMFISVKLRNLARLRPCDARVCVDAARASPSPSPLRPYISLQRGVRLLV